MRTFEQVIAALSEATSDPGRIPLAFRDLYGFTLVEEGGFSRLSESVQDILADLAFDLDYYEPDPKARQEDPSFYGPSRAVEVIESALSRLRSEGAV